MRIAFSKIATTTTEEQALNQSRKESQVAAAKAHSKLSRQDKSWILYSTPAITRATHIKVRAQNQERQLQQLKRTQIYQLRRYSNRKAWTIKAQARWWSLKIMPIRSLIRWGQMELLCTPKVLVWKEPWRRRPIRPKTHQGLKWIKATCSPKTKIWTHCGGNLLLRPSQEHLSVEPNPHQVISRSKVRNNISRRSWAPALQAWIGSSSNMLKWTIWDLHRVATPSKRPQTNKWRPKRIKRLTTRLCSTLEIYKKSKIHNILMMYKSPKSLLMMDQTKCINLSQASLATIPSSRCETRLDNITILIHSRKTTSWTISPMRISICSRAKRQWGKWEAIRTTMQSKLKLTLSLISRSQTRTSRTHCWSVHSSHLSTSQTTVELAQTHRIRTQKASPSKTSTAKTWFLEAQMAFHKAYLKRRMATLIHLVKFHICQTRHKYMASRNHLTW